MTNDRYTDEALAATIADTKALPGPRNAAPHLLRVPLEVRQEIEWEAHTMSNYQGGRYSSNIAQAVDTYLRNGTFPFRARAKAHRDAEVKANEGNLGPRIILPMN